MIYDYFDHGLEMLQNLRRITGADSGSFVEGAINRWPGGSNIWFSHIFRKLHEIEKWNEILIPPPSDPSMPNKRTVIFDSGCSVFRCIDTVMQHGLEVTLTGPGKWLFLSNLGYGHIIIFGFRWKCCRDLCRRKINRKEKIPDQIIITFTNLFQCNLFTTWELFLWIYSYDSN